MNKLSLLTGLFSVLLLTGSALVKAQPTEEEIVAELREKAMSNTLAYDILETLTTEVGARMAGTPQDAMAVEWGVKKFKELGFDKVWTEPVTFKTWIRAQEAAVLVSPYPHKIRITGLGFTVPTPLEGIEAEIVHFKTLQDLIDSPADSAKGKIVFISQKMERFRDGRGYGPVVKARGQGAVEAAKKGALAIVIRSIGTDSHRLPHTGMMRYKKGVKKIPAAAMSNPDADLLERILARKKPVKMNLKVYSHDGPEYTSYNVIGEMTGSEYPDEKVVIGGHLDSWDLGTGAVDDGAGVAITMAAAKIIGDSKYRPKRTVRVVLFANEEQGLIGARAYAAKHKVDLDNHVTGAESDFGAGKIYAFASNVAEDNLPVVKKMAELMKPLGIEYVDNKAGPGPDLIPMYSLGMSVFSLRQDGTDYFDLHHTEDDTLDKVVPENLSQNTAAYVVFAYIAANSEQKISRGITKTH
ncbi:M20/M25/M40 family metallo-hydrolase [Aliikangiella marina]|uniref:Carboxypeptidase Q n=1 Tax=Aliikangiella marina TaxID=1712262 RepID=A0A545THA8_9GAMM|nr:M20/M25/M40 family metallo-hydrolase [Aliikangiella marina]TQV76613.1 M20/M25/M40 family metallo-hydrolase [Aliikangiella marina]